MPDTLEVVIHASEQRGESSRRYSASLTDADAEPLSVWFDTPVEWSQAVTDLADPFLLIFLFETMRRQKPVRVHGTVSTSLLTNLELFMQIWQVWRPNCYRAVEIQADRETDPPTATGKNPAVMCFSGGIDASFTAYRHCHNLAGRRRQNLHAGIFVQGFYDTPLSEEQLYAAAMVRNRALLDSLNMSLIPLRTNAHDAGLIDKDSHGAAIGACLHLFGGKFHTGLIANSTNYSELPIVHGSNPLTDPLLSSRNLEVLDDGGEISRLDKVRRIKDWPELRQHLRVCNHGHGDRLNCGTCEKCIRTILAFHLLDDGLLPACFATMPTARQIQGMKLHHKIQIELIEEILDAARKAGRQERWMAACTRATARANRRVKRRHKRELKKVAGGKKSQVAYNPLTGDIR